MARSYRAHGKSARILITMPLSAMALAGSGPSLLQIYIDLVCKSEYPDGELSRGLASFSTLPHLLFGELGYHPSSVAGSGALNPSICAEDPNVQGTVATLAAGDGHLSIYPLAILMG